MTITAKDIQNYYTTKNPSLPNTHCTLSAIKCNLPSHQKTQQECLHLYHQIPSPPSFLKYSQHWSQAHPQVLITASFFAMTVYNYRVEIEGKKTRQKNFAVGVGVPRPDPTPRTGAQLYVQAMHQKMHNYGTR